AAVVVGRREGDPASGGEFATVVVVIVEGKPYLPEVVLASNPIGTLADLLHGRQQKTHQDADDGDHDQQFNKRERRTARATLQVFHHSHSPKSRPWRVLRGRRPALPARTITGPGPYKAQLHS